MAAYPSVGLQFSIRPVNNRRADVSDSGTVRSVDLSEQTAYRIDIRHPIIDSTDKTALQTFYDTHKGSVNTITLAGDTYDVHFLTDYAIESVSGSYYNMSTVLQGVRQ